LESNRRMLAALAGALMGSTAVAQTLPTHRIPAALAAEAASETVAARARQGYRETAQVVDADSNRARASFPEISTGWVEVPPSI
jgi:hypothetical protein